MAESRRSPRAAKSNGQIIHVFVDFENVPTVDLALIADKAVVVTLLIGEKQRRLDLGLVRQIHEHAAKVNLVEVGASGRNALDLVLAWHLGKTAERHPDDPFFVVSKDKDFDPLVAHLRASGLSVMRIDAFSALPFLSALVRTKKASGARTPASPGSASIVQKIETEPSHPADTEIATDDRISKISARLQQKTKARPVRRKTLLSYINGFYRNQLSEPELDAIVETLEQRGISKIDTSGRVTYPGPAVGE